MPSSLSDDVRRSATEAYGAVPNFLEAMSAHSGMPGAVYVAADEALMDGLLTPAEQQAVLLAVSAHHDSRYDGVAHARLALDAGLPPRVVDRLLAGKLPRDERLRALVEATRQTYDERGWLDDDTVEALKERGVGRGELYEIFALYGMKTFACFTNHLAGPEIDAPLKPTEERLDTVPEEPSTMEMRRLVLG
jgi:alkylhydroperoxidase family enzyme